MRNCAITVLSIITVLSLWITPSITDSKMNDELSTQTCLPNNITDKVCCGGAEPNFVIDKFSFSYEYDNDIISGLYIKIQNPTTQYWIRIVAFNVIVTIVWMTYAIVVGIARCDNRWDTSINRLNLNSQLLAFVLLGVASSLVFMYGGPTFPYEFRGFNDSDVFVKFNGEFIKVANLQLVKTTTRQHDGVPYDTMGLDLVASSNFSGIDAYPRVGPWVETIVRAKDWATNGVQHGIRLRDECVEQMSDIIILTGGNIIIPILFITTVFMTCLASPDNAPFKLVVVTTPTASTRSVTPIVKVPTAPVTSTVPTPAPVTSTAPVDDTHIPIAYPIDNVTTPAKPSV